MAWEYPSCLPLRGSRPVLLLAGKNWEVKSSRLFG